MYDDSPTQQHATFGELPTCVNEQHDEHTACVQLSPDAAADNACSRPAHLWVDIAQHEEQCDDQSSAVLAMNAVHEDGEVLLRGKHSHGARHAALGVLQQRFVQRIVAHQSWVGHSWRHDACST